MKYSNYLGTALCVALVAFCFAPWVYIEAIDTTITGMNTSPTNYGRPGVLHIFFAMVGTLCFLIPKVRAKRANVFVATCNFAWSIRNFMLISQCQMGECPEKKLGLYTIVFISALIIIMALLPKLDVKDVN